jgi:hypothetical protein
VLFAFGIFSVLVIVEIDPLTWKALHARTLDAVVDYCDDSLHRPWTF